MKIIIEVQDDRGAVTRIERIPEDVYTYDIPEGLPQPVGRSLTDVAEEMKRALGVPLEPWEPSTSVVAIVNRLDRMQGKYNSEVSKGLEIARSIAYGYVKPGAITLLDRQVDMIAVPRAALDDLFKANNAAYSPMKDFRAKSDTRRCALENFETAAKQAGWRAQ